MKKHKLLLLLLLSITISCNKCKKDPPPEPKVCEINGEIFDSEKGIQQMKDYMYFEVGTWWVYEEETTGDLDTITVYYNHEDIDENNYHWFQCYTYSSYTTYNFKYEYHESFTGGCAVNSACRCQKVQRSKTQPGDFVGAHRDFFFPTILGDNQPIGGSDLNIYYSVITSIVSNYVVGNLEFTNVVEYDVGWCFSEGGQPANFWLAEHIGIVKKELVDDGEVWNLVDYHIVQ